MAATYDVTVEFFLGGKDGNERLVKVTTTDRNKPGAKPFTDTPNAFGLNLSQGDPKVEFWARTRPTVVVGGRSVNDDDFDVNNESDVRDLDRTGEAVRFQIDFALTATDCPIGSHTPQRLVDNRTTKDGKKIETELRLV
ncbi:hypothetical protein [Streptomyces lydicus]|uniref:hypothetical protein n=1 Tax=Streptomyces lydicus TaxID=47763 RepID=UPI003795D3CF